MLVGDFYSNRMRTRAVQKALLGSIVLKKSLKNNDFYLYFKNTFADF